MFLVGTLESACLSVHPCVRISLCLSTCMSVCPSVYKILFSRWQLLKLQITFSDSSSLFLTSLQSFTTKKKKKTGLDQFKTFAEDNMNIV